MNFGGKVTYIDVLKTKKTLFLNHPIHTSDLLRPLVITTDEFQQKWAEASFEKRQKLSTSVKTVEELATKTKEALRLHPVEMIGKNSVT